MGTGLLIAAIVVGFIWAAAVFTPKQFGDVVGPVAQIVGGTVTALVGILGSAAFLIRKGQRVEELRWRIRTKLWAIEAFARAAGVTGHTATEKVAYLREGENARHLLRESQVSYDELSEVGALLDEFNVWRRVFRLGRAPEVL